MGLHGDLQEERTCNLVLNSLDTDDLLFKSI